MSTLTNEQVATVAGKSVHAFITQDPDALDAAMQPAYEGDTADMLRVILMLIEVAVQDMPHRRHLPEKARETATLKPFVAARDEVTGQYIDLDMDALPLGISTYARLAAAWIAEDPKLGASVWEAMLQARERIDATEDPIGVCLFYALTNAAAAVRATQAKARLQ